MIEKIKFDDPRLKELLSFEKSRNFLYDHTGFIRLARMGILWGFIENEELLAAIVVTKQMKTYTVPALVVHKNKRAQKIGKELLQEIFNKYSDKPVLGFVFENNVAVRRLVASLGCTEGATINGLVAVTKPVAVSN